MAIVRLDEQTINKIAAGEVIDGPASIVKECVEIVSKWGNDITVSVVQGGISSIKIQDNGTGMSRDDLLLAPIRTHL